MITLRNTVGNQQQCTRNLLSLRPHTDDKVISSANSLGQYFFPKHRYGWIIAILNCLMIFFPLSCNLFRGLYFYHLANSYWQSDIHCRIKHSSQSIKNQAAVALGFGGRNCKKGRRRDGQGRCFDDVGCHFLAGGLAVLLADPKMGWALQFPPGSFSSGFKFWLFEVFALLATAVWGTQAIRPGSEPFRGLVMERGFFSP